MPELPEVETTLRGIAPHMLGRTIKHIDITQPMLRWPVPEEIHTLNGARVTNLRRRAKYLIIETTAGCAIMHLGMSGSLRVVNDDAQRRKHDHVEFLLCDKGRIRYHDPRRFGALLWTDKQPENHPLLQTLGPEPLGNEFNGDRLFRLSRRKKVAVKNFIMNNSIVVGVGNIYANEALFLAGIRPGKAAGRITAAAYETLAGHIRQTLQRAIDMGGTTLRDFVNSSGEPGYFQQSLHVYGRHNEPCTHCSTQIKMKVIGQRSTFYCPECQR